MAFALDLRPPGVVLQRSPPARRIARLRHHELGIVGVARRGPLHRPVRVQSVPDFVRVFGSATAQGLLALSVEGFFANGGAVAWVVRVADPEQAAPAAAYLAFDGGAVRLEATSPGSWGRAMTLRTVRTGTRRFSLLIQPPDAAPEPWGGLTFDFRPDEDQEDRRIETILKGSAWLRARGAFPAGTLMRPLAETSQDGHLEGGADGIASLTLDHFDGQAVIPAFLADEEETEPQPRPLGLRSLERIDRVAIVAIPDIMFTPGPRPKPSEPKKPSCDLLELPPGPPEPLPQDVPEPRDAFGPDQRLQLQQRLIEHCRTMRDRVAILDADVDVAVAQGATAITRAIEQRKQFSSDFGALYFPWLETVGAEGVRRILPPSGHVAGVYARVTLDDDVHQPPANEVLEGVAGLTWHTLDQEHARLNGQHVNVIRVLPGRGIRVMGARTLLRDGALQFVNVRRLINLIAESIDESTQWIPFEPNNLDLQDVVGRVVRNFLDLLWRRGMLDGATAEEAYSVVCDASVNPPAETERGRLICEIGLQPPLPAEFVLLRLVQTETGVVLDTVAETSDA